MSAIDELNWFLKNIEQDETSSHCDWLNEQREAILQMKTENERRRAVRQLIVEYKALHRVD